jgi:aspartate 1-decarboxylase
MDVTVLRSKIHRIPVTRSDIDYEGSLELDANLFDRAGFVPHEKVLVANLRNGERFETYVIRGGKGERVVCLNGAAARLGEIGDLLIIFAFARMPIEEARRFEPIVLRGEDL